MSRNSTLFVYRLCLYTLIIIFTARLQPLLAQTSCKGVERTVLNGKSTNSNSFDDIGVIMTNILNDSSETGWLFEPGTKFIENLDGTANLKGTIKQFGSYPQERRFEVDLTLYGQTFTPPPGSPYNKTKVPTAGWYYYNKISGTFKGLDGIAGGELSIVLHMKAFQAGIGANQVPDEPLDMVTNGGSGWFEWTVEKQPTTGILFNDYIMDTTVADIVMLLEGTPSIPCCTAKAGGINIEPTELMLEANGKVAITGKPTSDSDVPAGYKVIYLLTDGDSSILRGKSGNPIFNVTDTGKFCIHTLVYDPNTLDLQNITLGNVKLKDLANMLIENGGTICASLDKQGDCVYVKPNPCADDQTPPTIKCPTDISVTTNSHCGVAQWTAPIATDNCGAVSLVMTTAPVAGWQNGSCFPIGTTTVTYTATDAKGNKATCSFKINVISTCDNVTSSGTIVKKCINNETILSVDSLPSGGTGTIEYQWMKSIYACPDSLEHAIAGANGTTLNVGVLTQKTYYRLCSRRSGCNNWVGETACLTVEPNECNPCINDTIRPIIKCPTDITLTTNGNCAVATWTTPTATDNCSSPVITSNYASGYCFPIGTTTVTYTATDAKGNKAICSFTVTVKKQNPTGSIGDFVWNDKNQNGIQDSSEVGLSGVKVQLLDSAKNVIATMATDANGKYSFIGLAAGIYTLKFQIPAGFLVTRKDIGNNETDSDIDVNGEDIVVLSSNTETNITKDAGFYANPCVDDKTPPVFTSCPSNISLNTGMSCATATWVAPKAIDNCGSVLITSNYNSGYCFPEGTTTVMYIATDANGNKDTCSFTVTVKKQNPTGSIGDFVWCDRNQNGLQDAGENGMKGVKVQLLDTARNIIASTVTDSTGKYLFTGLAAGTYILKVEIPAGFVPTTKNAGNSNLDSDIDSKGESIVILTSNEANSSKDAGFYPEKQVNSGKIGDFVWCDRNQNGVQDAGENGMKGVRVQLLDANKNVLMVDTTDASGKYLFSGLSAGTYILKFDIPVGFSATRKDVGDNDLDSDIDSKGEDIVILSSNTEVNLSKDAGFYPEKQVNSGKIGDFVWCDRNQNGLQDAGENGMSGIKVELLDSTKKVIMTTTTDASGKYLFSGLGAGTYTLKFQIPSGFVPTLKDVHTDRTLDSDIDANGQETVVLTTNTEVNLSKDAGFYPAKPASTGKLGDFVWCDRNQNGVQDAGENGMKGVRVQLLDANRKVLMVDTTDAYGKYLFSGLAAGTYILKYEIPTGFIVTRQDIGDNDLDSDIDSKGEEIVILSSNTEVNLSKDAGFYPNPCADDDKAPVISGCPSNITLTTSSSCAVATWVAPRATDNCSTPTLTSNYNSGYCFPVGTTTVTYTATDAKGNKATCSFTVTVKKSVDCNTVTGNTISISCVNNLPVLTGTDLSGFEYQWMCSTSGCPTRSTQAIAGATGQNYSVAKPLSTTTYFVRCARPVGCTTWGPINESNCVKVSPTDCSPCANDVTAPILTSCPSDISLTTNGTCASATWTAPKATDNCGTPTITSTHNSGFCFPIGTTKVTYTATDLKGNKSTCSFNVTVKAVCNPKITFINKCSFGVNVFWDNNGTKVKYATLYAGQSCTVNTYNGHKWMVCDFSGKQVMTYTVNGCTDQTVNITSAMKCEVVFYNKSGATCNVFLVSPSGQKTHYKTLYKCESYTQTVEIGQKWMVCNTAGQTLSNFTVTQCGTTWCNIYAANCWWWFLNSAQVLTLDANVTSGRTALNWVNNTGFKNDYFVVQRINNTTGEFEDLKTINAKEENNSLMNYTEYDNNPQEGDNHYRVKLSYLDGTIGYTETKIVRSTNVDEVKVFPNPATEYFELDLSNYEGKAVKITVYNTWGQAQLIQDIESVTTQPYRIDVNKLGMGNFNINITAQGKRPLNKRLTITK